MGAGMGGQRGEGVVGWRIGGYAKSLVNPVDYHKAKISFHPEAALLYMYSKAVSGIHCTPKLVSY